MSKCPTCNNQKHDTIELILVKEYPHVCIFRHRYFSLVYQILDIAFKFSYPNYHYQFMLLCKGHKSFGLSLVKKVDIQRRAIILVAISI